MRRVNRVQAGFTLIEILIVILIISIVSTVAIMTLTFNQHKPFEQLAEQLTNLIQLAEEEALLSRKTLGLAFSSQSFDFFTFEKQRWQPITSGAQSVFRRQSLPDQASITVSVFNKKQPSDGKPQLIMTGDDGVPFIILIGKKNQVPLYEVIGDANGEVRYQRYSK